ncbi:Ig-like domain-containing protein [Alcanivorax sp. JB21]|uniref:Ig-like domain-containing protein n=1 Tax=Alcanivorax limicola TaxID=2874102 RepID=UPI001CBF1DAE|nr:Ig-like domain-containing protein [Alcanivorax limicola]MBZ2187903.1 Ig-like domain-containing protein [Alcanivorax limicola]
MKNNTDRLLSLLALWAVIAASSGCDNSPTPFKPPEIGDGLIYTYPLDNAVDIPHGSKALFVFSHQVDADEVAAGCGAVDAAAVPEGSFCIIGPDGPVDISDRISVVNAGRSLQVTLDGLISGGRYAVWLREPAAPGAVNLPGNTPLMHFRMRQSNPVPDAPPTVLAINHNAPDAYAEPAASDPRFPFMDFSPVRITFSEPLAQQTVRYGETFELLHRDDTGQASLVPANVYAERHYISLQPEQDLIPGERYELRLSSDIRDLGGDALAEETFVLIPLPSKAEIGDDNPPIRQVLRTFPAPGDPGFPRQSQLSDTYLNSFELVTEVLGAVETSTYPDSLEAFLADPVLYPNYTPILSRHGQSLRLTGINPAKIGGQIDTNLMTGDIGGLFFTNVTAYLLRNPHRPHNTNPDDALAPLTAVMHFDVAMVGEDEAGNATFNQNLMHVQAPGIVSVYDGSLNFEVFTTLQLEALGGAARINADFSLGIRSSQGFVVDESNPHITEITGTYPADGEVNFPTRENIMLTFSRPLSNNALDEIQLLDMSAGGTPVPIRVNRDGTTLTVTPLAELASAAEHRLMLPAGLSDSHLFNPMPVVPRAGDALGGDGELVFSTANYAGTATPPMILILHPGVGCALADAGTQEGKAGRCAGGLSSDVHYERFHYEIGTMMEITFSQPMDVTTLRAGTISADGSRCTDGPVCLGKESEGSWQNIPVSTHIEDRSMQLYPGHDALQPGQAYRLVVNGNSAPAFRNHARFGNLRLNTTPMAGIRASGNQGGANILVDFDAIDQVSTIFANVRTMPYSDTNGNGVLDTGEVEQLLNSGRLQVVGTGGLITGASPSSPGDDFAFTSGGLPASFFPVVPLDLSVSNLGMEPQGPNRWCSPEGYDDGAGNPVCIDTEGGFMAPVEVGTPLVLGTALSLDAIVAGLIPLQIQTGALILRVRPRDEGPKRGYVINVAGESQAQFLIRLEAYLDAPDLNLLGLGNPSNLYSLPIAAYVMGPVIFMEDGRLALQAENLTAIDARLDLDLSNANFIGQICSIPVLGPILCGITTGHADLRIEPGDFNITVANHPTRGLRLIAP